MSLKQFKLKSLAKRNCVYLYVNFEGGDADTNHPQSYLIKDVTMDNIDEHADTVNTLIKNFKTLKDILDNDGKYDTNYNEVKEEYGEEIARMYDNAPNDPQSDYQFKCYVDSIELHAYNEDGDLYTQYIR